MPFLDIATPQPSFRNNLYSLGFQRIRHVSGNQTSARWRYFRPSTIFISTASLEMCRGRLIINAVATMEPRCSDKENGTAQHLPVDSTNKKSSSIQDEKEMLRRKRISKANKGKDPWNKGRPHSPETRQKIRERTKVAMLSEEVKEKLRRGVHEQSHETRLKIGAAVRRSWFLIREKQRNVADCQFAWNKLIAEACRKGMCGEAELQWDSFDIISQQLEKERLEEKAAKAAMIKPKGSIPFNRLPKSAEQRRKISEAISAKWADPAYRNRVESGRAISKGEDPGKPRETKKKEAKKVKPPEKRDGLHARRTRNSWPTLKPSRKQTPKEPRPRYKDPQAGYKLEMIKSIRAQRAASNPKIIEAVTRANVLIREAQRAAEALEVAAAKSPVAEASLVETRKLIAEAISYIKSIETVNTGSPESDSDEDVKVAPESDSDEDVKIVSEMEQMGVNGVGGVGLSDAEIAKTSDVGPPGVSQIEQIGVNGVGGVGAEIAKFGEFSKVVMEDEDVVANGTERVDLAASSSSSWGLKFKEAEEDGGRKMASEKEGGGGGGKGRRWVCGRLVEDE